MKPEAKETAVLRSLEELLLQPKTRKNPARLADLLADEFIEFGSSGRIFEKRSVIVGSKWQMIFHQGTPAASPSLRSN